MRKSMFVLGVFAAVFIAVFPCPSGAAPDDVVINEIAYHMESECDREEFVEIYNRGEDAIDLEGWEFKRGVRYRFPAGASIEAGEYAVVCRDILAFQDTYGSIANLWGPYDGQLDNGGERIVLESAEGREIDRVEYDDKQPWPVKADGEGATLDLINPWAGNRDFSYWRASDGPTPGRRNTQYSDILPPIVRRITHTPHEPTSNNSAIIKAYVDGGGNPVTGTLHYQVVPPGGYIRITDPAYQTAWIDLLMRDDGQAPDQSAGDGVFTAQVPEQAHRTLVRYRARFENDLGAATWAPYTSDPQPNGAYFVYDGVPPYEATDPETRAHTVLEKVPVYHLIAAKEDTDECQYHTIASSDKSGRREYRWTGTFVGGGNVYDHVRFRLRGGVWRYTFNKRMWKIKFNQGHYFHGVDNDGTPYPEPRRVLNLNAVTQNMNIPVPHRGECGLFEWAGFTFFKMAGVGGSTTTFTHFRVIDEESETGRDQYSGDFFGIFLEVEQPDSRFLSTNGYSGDCNLYKMNHGWTVDGKIWEKETNNCDPEDDSDIETFYHGYNRGGTAYLEEHLDIERYLSYRCILEAIHHYDIYAQKNYYYLNNVETGRWEVLPWDLDITFGSDHGSGTEPFRDCIVGNLSRSRRPVEGPYATQFRNRLREIVQLLYNEDVFFPILDDTRDLIVELVAADRDRWDNFRPLDASPSKAHYRSLDERLAEMRTWIEQRIRRDYTDTTGNFVRSLEGMAEDSDIPNQPGVITPEDRLDVSRDASVILTGTPFSDPNPADTLLAMRWIVTEESGNELQPDWSIHIPGGDSISVAIPAGVLDIGKTYRCRVRHKDQSGRWSLWSKPATFTVRDAVGVEEWEVH